MRWLVGGGVLVALVATSVATGVDDTSEQLVGWSVDGTHYAVIVHANDDESLEVRAGGKTVVTIDRDDVTLEDTDKHTALQRVNVRTHSALAKFRLERVSARWRNSFKAQYELVPIRRRRGEDDTCKLAGWRLVRRADKAVVREYRVKRGCLYKVSGGYLHPTGKTALIKSAEGYWESDEVRATEHSTERYELVSL